MPHRPDRWAVARRRTGTFSSTNSEKAVDLSIKWLTEFVVWAALISVARPPLANSTAGTLVSVAG
jgi:hypothetical protein